VTRFSDDELLEITRIAVPRIDAGLWSHLERDSGDEFDRILIWLSDGKTNCRLERDASGWTYLLFCISTEWRLIASGTLTDCLRAFSMTRQ
jgi:hypothetical protein